MRKFYTQGILYLFLAGVGTFSSSPFLCIAGSQFSLAHSTEEAKLPALHKAAYYGNVRQVRALCHTADLAQQDHNGRQALHFAAAGSSLSCAIELLKAGADMYAEDYKNQTALLHAIAVGSYPICLFFLQKRKDAETSLLSASEKSLALAIAAFYGQSDILKLLRTQARAPMNEQAIENGGTPLHWSIFGKHIRITDYLLKHGANVNAEDCHKRRTALHLAAASATPEFVTLLLAYGADTDLTDKNGNTPLDEAVRCKNYLVVQLLRRIKQRNTQPYSSDTQLSSLAPSTTS